MNSLFLGRQISEHGIVSTADPRIPFGPLNKCIYCENETDPAKLELEHIIPANIGGNLEFEKSSCRVCATKTGRIEQKCLRAMFDAPRGIHGLRKRKHKDASTVAKYQFIKGGIIQERHAEFSKTPPNMIPLFITKTLPPILFGIPESAHTQNCVSYANLDMGAFEAAHKKEGGIPGVDLIKLEHSYYPGLLSQMVAKIAHSYAVAQIGLTFTPFLQQHILIKDPAPDSYRIGSFELDMRPYIHLISLFQYPAETLGQYGLSHIRQHWLVRLQLFAWRSSLVFFIVVGSER